MSKLHSFMGAYGSCMRTFPYFLPSHLPHTHAHRVHGQGDDIEESSLALGDSALGSVHERADGLAQRPLAVALSEHLLCTFVWCTKV